MARSNPVAAGDVVEAEESFRIRAPSGDSNVMDRGSILCDEETDELVSAQDIDLHCAMEGMNISKERFHKFRELLPLRFVGDMNVLQVKAEAKWSVASNARQHPLVLETIEVEVAKRKGKCRLALLEMVAFI